MISSRGDYLELSGNKRKIRYQMFFISVFHDFRWIELSEFCRSHGIWSTGRKDALIERIWDNNYSFEDINIFIKQRRPVKGKGAKETYMTERIQIRITPELQSMFQRSRELYKN